MQDLAIASMVISAAIFAKLRTRTFSQALNFFLFEMQHSTWYIVHMCLNISHNRGLLCASSAVSAASWSCSSIPCFGIGCPGCSQKSLVFLSLLHPQDTMSTILKRCELEFMTASINYYGDCWVLEPHGLTGGLSLLLEGTTLPRPPSWRH